MALSEKVLKSIREELDALEKRARGHEAEAARIREEIGEISGALLRLGGNFKPARAPKRKSPARKAAAKKPGQPLVRMVDEAEAALREGGPMDLPALLGAVRKRGRVKPSSANSMAVGLLKHVHSGRILRRDGVYSLPGPAPKAPERKAPAKKAPAPRGEAPGTNNKSPGTPERPPASPGKRKHRKKAPAPTAGASASTAADPILGALSAVLRLWASPAPLSMVLGKLAERGVEMGEEELRALLEANPGLFTIARDGKAGLKGKGAV